MGLPPRKRQLLYTILLIATLLTIVLRTFQQLWYIAAIVAAYLPWGQRQYLRLGLWSWLNGQGRHWIDEPTTRSDNPPHS